MLDHELASPMEELIAPYAGRVARSRRHRQWNAGTVRLAGATVTHGTNDNHSHFVGQAAIL